MTLKDKIENNAAVVVLSLLLTAYVSGIGSKVFLDSQVERQIEKFRDDILRDINCTIDSNRSV